MENGRRPRYFDFLGQSSSAIVNAVSANRPIQFAVIITCTRYKVPIGIIRAPKLVARPSVANRETRSDSLSIDRSLHSACGRSFRDRCNCAYTSVLIGGSCTARLSATDDCMKSRHGANLLRATSVYAR